MRTVRTTLTPGRGGLAHPAFCAYRVASNRPPPAVGRRVLGGTREQDRSDQPARRAVGRGQEGRAGRRSRASSTWSSARCTRAENVSISGFGVFEKRRPRRSHRAQPAHGRGRQGQEDHRARVPPGQVLQGRHRRHGEAAQADRRADRPRRRPPRAAAAKAPAAAAAAKATTTRAPRGGRGQDGGCGRAATAARRRRPPRRAGRDHGAREGRGRRAGQGRDDGRAPRADRRPGPAHRQGRRSTEACRRRQAGQAARAAPRPPPATVRARLPAAAAPPDRRVARAEPADPRRRGSDAAGAGYGVGLRPAGVRRNDRHQYAPFGVPTGPIGTSDRPASDLTTPGITPPWLHATTAPPSGSRRPAAPAAAGRRRGRPGRRPRPAAARPADLAGRADSASGRHRVLAALSGALSTAIGANTAQLAAPAPRPADAPWRPAAAAVVVAGIGLPLTRAPVPHQHHPGQRGRLQRERRSARPWSNS